jgi:hypothetical protein
MHAEFCTETDDNCSSKREISADDTVVSANVSLLLLLLLLLLLFLSRYSGLVIAALSRRQCAKYCGKGAVILVACLSVDCAIGQDGGRSRAIDQSACRTA